MEKKKSTSLGGRIWFSAIFFGLVGQIAWIVENMYFATFAQDVFSNSGRSDLSYIVTTLMVILSALAATATTIFAGGLVDKVGKRKPFIAFGYIAWGITIMLFALIPMKVEGKAAVALVATLLVAFDCIMTFAGSTSNDAAFNAWVADNTDETNRGKINGVLSTLPLLAVVIVFVALGPLYSKENESNWLFFFLLGIIPMIAGVVALFTLKDAEKLEKSSISFKETFYGFKLSVIKNNKMLYITLITSCLVGIAQQTFYSYLINFLIITLGLGDSFVIPMAVIVVGSGLFTGVCGFILDKYGRKHFYIPLLLMTVIGILSYYSLQFTGGTLKMIVLYVGGVVMMGGLLSTIGALTANFQDYIPEKCEGRFQGVRMCFTVLIPMIIGPIISLVLGMDAMGMNGESFVPPYSMFLAAAIVGILAIIPIFVIRKNKKAE